MNKTLTRVAAAAALLAPLAFAMPALAATDWDVSGSYDVDFTCTFGCPAGPYAHDMNLVQDSSDNLTGSGGHPANGLHVYTWVLTSGSVSDSAVTLTADYTASADAVTPQTTMSMTGAIAPDGTMSGTWTDNYQGGSRGGTWVTTAETASLSGGVAPIVSAVTTPSPVVAGMPTTLTANVNDTTTGNSNIASAAYRITGGDWVSMNAADTFDSPNENATVTFAFDTPGVKEVCVRGADVAGNMSSPSGDDCIIVSVIDPLTGYVSGGGNIRDGKGKPLTTFGGNAGYVPDVGLVGQLQVVNHSTKQVCHYDTITGLQVEDGLATVTASGRCNGSPVGPVELTYEDNGEPGTLDQFIGTAISGGNIQVGGETLGVKTFTALDSVYYNGMTPEAGLYGTGPINFTWDIATGNVTGGVWEEIVPPESGTHYFNIVTGGTVSGDDVTLTLQRINPNAYGPFIIEGTLIGGVLTGTAAGPYLFEATGTITP